jgi:GTP-binding protein HflX
MKFYSDPIPEHDEVPLADDGRWEETVELWSQKDLALSSESETGVYVLSVGENRDPVVRQAQLKEILALVEAQGDVVVGFEIYHLNKARPRTLIGKGTSRAVAQRARDCGAGILVLDAHLSPSQMRNLEDDAGIKVLDREGVILNVFLRNASSRQSKIQVEIAQLEYLRPRIRGVGLDMDQQMGGVAGSRGPGETASELLARNLDSRLAELRKANEKLLKAGENRRQRREECQRIALVGYTNAGKTSLLNALTEENFSSRDRPFETLDTVSRSLSRHGESVVVSDTVGFIRNLPERLMESFESTLAEVREATLIALVVDVSDYEWREHLATTLEVLNRLNKGTAPRFFIFNKVDLLSRPMTNSELEEVTEGFPYQLVCSVDPDSVEELKEALLLAVRKRQSERSVFIPYRENEILDMVYSGCRVLSTDPTSHGLKLRIEGPVSVVSRIEKALEEVR